MKSVSISKLALRAYATTLELVQALFGCSLSSFLVVNSVLADGFWLGLG
jgi:hypothetical protein